MLSCLETLVGHVIFLKGLIAAAFESSEPLHLLRLIMGVSAPSLLHRECREELKGEEVRGGTLPTKTYQVWAMESRDTATVMQLHNRTSARILYLHKIKMAYDREEGS